MKGQFPGRFLSGIVLLGALAPAWSDPLTGMVDWKPADRALYCTQEQYICFQGHTQPAGVDRLILTRDGQAIATTAGSREGDYFFARSPGAPGPHVFKLLAVKAGRSVTLANVGVTVIDKAPATVSVRNIPNGDDEVVMAAPIAESAFKATRLRVTFGDQSFQVPFGPEHPAKFVVPASTASPGPTPLTIDALDARGARFELASSVIVVGSRLDLKLPASIVLRGAKDAYEVEPYLQMGMDFRRVDYYAAAGVPDAEGKAPRTAKWMKIGSSSAQPFTVHLDFKPLSSGEIMVRADGMVAGGRIYHTKIYSVSLRRK